SERDDELDAELLREVDDQPRKRAPAQVRLDAEQENRVPREPLRTRVVESVLGPVDAPCEPFDERHLRARGLEVEEILGVDVGEPARLPFLRQVATCERGALRAVVPAPEG